MGLPKNWLKHRNYHFANDDNDDDDVDNEDDDHDDGDDDHYHDVDNDE